MMAQASILDFSSNRDSLPQRLIQINVNKLKIILPIMNERGSSLNTTHQALTFCVEQ